MTRCAVIVLVWNGEKYISACLDALIAQNDGQAELIVVDNASTDASREIVRRYGSQVRLITNSANLGFSGGNNVGIAATDADVVVLLNQDTEVHQGWLRAILDTFLSDPQIGIVGCKALYPDGRIQHAGAKIAPTNALAIHIGQGEDDRGQYDQFTDADYVTGAAFAIHRQVLKHLRGLDERFNPALYEEVDYCYRARRLGYRIVYQPKATLTHHESTSLPKPHYAIHYLLHRNRLHFIALHWGNAQWVDWSQTERRDVNEAKSLSDVLARSRAYLESALAWPGVWKLRQADKTLGGQLSEEKYREISIELFSLWKGAHRRISTMLGQAQLAWKNELIQSTSPEKNQFVSDVAFWEPDVRSTKPVIGSVVNWLRKLWLNTFVRPYVVPVFQRLIWQQHDLHLRLQATEDMLQALNNETEILIDQALLFPSQDSSQKMGNSYETE